MGEPVSVMKTRGEHLCASRHGSGANVVAGGSYPRPYDRHVLAWLLPAQAGPVCYTRRLARWIGNAVRIEVERVPAAIVARKLEDRRWTSTTPTR